MYRYATLMAMFCRNAEYFSPSTSPNSTINKICSAKQETRTTTLQGTNHFLPSSLSISSRPYLNQVTRMKMSSRNQTVLAMACAPISPRMNRSV